MIQQKLDFNGPIKQYIHNYHEAPKQESKTQGTLVKVTPTQKEAIRGIIKERGLGEGESTFVAKAVDFFIQWLPYESAFTNCSEDIEAIVKIIAKKFE